MGVYEELGLAPIINASGTVTRLGGAPMPPAVVAALAAAAEQWVPLEQLQAAASRRIAAVTGAEAGLVTAGSAAALTLGTAALLAGHDLGRMERLPHCRGFPHEIVVAREHRSGYDHAVRAAGARLVEVGFNEVVAGAGVRRAEGWEYEAAFSERTAGVLYVFSSAAAPTLNEVVQRAQRHQDQEGGRDFDDVGGGDTGLQQRRRKQAVRPAARIANSERRYVELLCSYFAIAPANTMAYSYFTVVEIMWCS